MAYSRKATFGSAAATAVNFVAVLILIELADLSFRHFYGLTLDGFGIRPRELVGLVGVVFSPLLHGNWVHLVANAVPLLVLLTVLFWDRRYRPGSTLGWIWLVSGLGTWAIGRPETVHIGASSLVYGLVAYLMAAGILMRSWRSAFVALAVGLVFSGIWYGALPQEGPISWEGHLCGAVAGVFAARKAH
jgi:membrane associated rhomboid family serine protease